MANSPRLPPSYDEFWRRKYEAEHTSSNRVRLCLFWFAIVAVVAVTLIIVGVVIFVVVLKDTTNGDVAPTAATDSVSSSVSATTSVPQYLRHYNLSLPFAISNRTQVVPYANSSSEPFVFVFDADSNNVFFLSSDANILVRHTINISSECQSCKLYYVNYDCAENMTCVNQNVLFCCSNCPASKAYCNVNGDVTTISGFYPLLGGVYIVRRESQMLYLINVKYSTGTSTNLQSYKFTGQQPNPDIVHAASTQFTSAEQIETLQFLFHNYSSASANDRLFWRVFVKERSNFDALIQVSTSDGNISPSFSACKIPTLTASSSIRLQLSSIDATSVQITVVDQDTISSNTLIFACYASITQEAKEVRTISGPSNTVIDVATDSNGAIYVLDKASVIYVYNAIWIV